MNEFERELAKNFEQLAADASDTYQKNALLCQEAQKFLVEKAVHFKSIIESKKEPKGFQL